MRIICSPDMMDTITPQAENEAAKSLLDLVRRSSECSVGRLTTDTSRTKKNNNNLFLFDKNSFTAKNYCRSGGCQPDYQVENHGYPSLFSLTNANGSMNQNAFSSTADEDSTEGGLVVLPNSPSFLLPPPAVPNRVTCSSPLATSSIDSNDSSSNASIESHNISNTDDCLIASISSSSPNKADVPAVLMTLLLDPENHNTLTFLPSNRAFVISNRKAFARVLMRNHFKLTKFGCFVGKLQRWGFNHHSDASNPECHFFYHPHFIKDDWKSLLKIKYSPRSNKEDAVRLKRSAAEMPSACVERGHLHFQGVRQAIDRHVELTTMCDSLRVHRRMKRELSLLDDDDAGTRTKNIINAAIACLMRDEDHTRDLIAREKSSHVAFQAIVAHRERNGSKGNSPFYQMNKTQGRGNTNILDDGHYDSFWSE